MSVYTSGIPRQDCYNDKRIWLEYRFAAIVDEIKQVGMRGMPIEELCREAAEVACWLGQAHSQSAVHNFYAQRVDEVKMLDGASQ